MSPRKLNGRPRGVTKFDEVIGVRLRQARIKEHLSQSDLGLALGVSFQQVQKYEKGVNRVSGSRLTQIAKTLNTPISYFMDDISVRRSDKAIAVDKFMATRQGIQIVEAMLQLSEKHQQTIIDLARSLIKDD